MAASAAAAAAQHCVQLLRSKVLSVYFSVLLRFYSRLLLRKQQEMPEEKEKEKETMVSLVLTVLCAIVDVLAPLEALLRPYLAMPEDQEGYRQMWHSFVDHLDPFFDIDQGRLARGWSLIEEELAAGIIDQEAWSPTEEELKPELELAAEIQCAAAPE